MSLSRRAPLKQGKPLERGTGLARGARLVRRVPLKAVSNRAPKARSRSPRGSVRAAVALVLAGHTTVAEAARVTGANPESVEAAAWKEAKRLVHDRDSETCLACGKRGTNVHHRVRRGAGGTANPATEFGMANLILLCGTGTTGCHGWVHANPDAARVMGWLLLESQDPAAEPVTVAVSGGWRKYWLTASGEYAEQPEEVAA